MIVGIDGGGTHTRAMVSDETGAQLATAEGLGSAVRPGEVERSADVIATAVAESLRLTGVEGARARYACVGVSGVGRDDERAALTAALLERDVADDVLVVTDAEVALEDAFGEGPGVLLIAGTGSICYGRGPAGALARCGGWGPVIGDEGSGAWLGRRVLGVVAAAADGREPETALTPAVLATTGAATVDGLIAWAAAAAPAQLALLVPPLLDAAKGGDLRANALVTLGVEELALHVRTLARKLFVDERAAVPVALAGGLTQKGSLVRRRLDARLKSMVPGAQIRADDVVPVRGAVKRALRQSAMAR